MKIVGWTFSLVGVFASGIWIRLIFSGVGMITVGFMVWSFVFFLCGFAFFIEAKNPDLKPMEEEMEEEKC